MHATLSAPVQDAVEPCEFSFKPQAEVHAKALSLTAAETTRKL
jgi:hypothetical protein